MAAHHHRYQANDPASALLQLGDGAISGSCGGALTKLRLENGSWAEEACVTVQQDVAIEDIRLLIPGLIVVGCAGELVVRRTADLGAVEGGIVATCCTGPFCVQERVVAAGSSEPRARACAAQHTQLLLVDVDDGSADATLGAMVLRCTPHGRIPLMQPARALHWRASHLCVAHADSLYLVMDSATGDEVWRLHLMPQSHTATTPKMRRPPTPASGGGGSAAGSTAAAPSSIGRSVSAAELGTPKRSGWISPYGMRSAARAEVETEAELCHHTCNHICNHTCNHTRWRPRRSSRPSCSRPPSSAGSPATRAAARRRSRRARRPPHRRLPSLG